MASTSRSTLEQRPNSDNDNDSQACSQDDSNQHSKDVDQDRNSGRDLGKDSDCESTCSREGPTTKDDISWDHDRELYGTRKSLQLDIHWKPAEQHLVHAAPIFSPAAHLPSPSLSHTLPPSSTTAEIQTSVTTAAASTLMDAPVNAATLPHPMTTIEPTMALTTSSEPLLNMNTEVPTSSFAAEPQRTPQVDSSPVFGGPNKARCGGSSIGTHRHQIRKALNLQLNACTCGVTITDLEILEGQSVIKCHTPGCETVWVCISCSFAYSQSC